MPALSGVNKSIFLRLKTAYNELNWFSKLFFPNMLAGKLENIAASNLSTPDAFEVYQAYKSQTWFFHRWLFTSLNHFFNTDLNHALRSLSEADLLSGDGAQANFDAVVGHQVPRNVADVLKILSEADLLTGDSAQANRDVVVGHQDPRNVADVLKILSEVGLLTGDGAQANRDAVVGHQDPRNVAEALSRLSRAGLLTGDGAQANFDAVVGHQRPQGVADALENLSQAGILSGDGAQANRDAVVGHQNPHGVAYALKNLSQTGLLSGDGAQANFDAVIGHQNPWGVAYALKNLSQTGILSGDGAQENFNDVVSHQHPWGVAYSLKNLSQAGLLTGDDAQANFDAVVGCQSCNGLSSALRLLRLTGLLGVEIEQSQARFNQLMEYQNILFHEDTRNLWDRIPPHMFTKVNWNHIIRLCMASQVNLEAGREHFARYVDQPSPSTNYQQQVFNSAQSTHTASVHQTVSASARRLKERYKDVLANLNESLQTIVHWVNKLEGHDVEKRALQQLVGSSYTFKDPTSDVTTKELLALSWAAINDDAMRLGKVKDAQVCFLEGLYDIQRAYNLSDTFEDRGGHDKQACASGTFNKLIEKLVGIHPDAKITYITNQGAMRKLLPLVREAATQFLKEHLGDITVEELKHAIFRSVREQLFFEYGHALEALTKDYDTFELFQASDKYKTFCLLLNQRQDEHLEQMIEGKLSIADKELDEELSDLMVPHSEAKLAPEDIEEKPVSREDMREKRLRFFDAPPKSSEGSDPPCEPLGSSTRAER